MNELTESQTEPLVKSVTVPTTVARAFELFTVHLQEWWPLATHSVGQADAAGVALDGREGGQIVETLDDGSSCVWGTVLEWEPPTRLAFTWHPGSPADQAATVSVTFHDAPDGTRVELVHSGWERRPDGVRARAGYDTGWDYVLGRYVTRVADR
jgi:uncharacterized protein YndB with AHSA1/START domain